MTLLAIFVILLFAYGLVSRRLEGTVLTGPILFTVAGVGVAIAAPTDLAAAVNSKGLLHLAEIGLVLLLFTDAGRTDLALLWEGRALPARLLGIGLPLTIVLGTVAGWLIFPQLSIWEVAILAAILAPTDAGLGQIIVTSPRVPARIRQALNVEAGLNDGLSVPFLLFFIALAAVASDRASFAQFVVEQLGYGAMVGLAIGLIGGALLGWTSKNGWMTNPFKQIGMVVLPVLCLIVSLEVSASAFIASFVAGIAVQPGVKDAGAQSMEFGEIWSQAINLAVFFLFGMVVVRHWQDVDIAAGVYAVASLTIVRLLPVALSLMGTGLGRSTVVFMGWFGPRGLASIVLGLVFLEHEIDLAGEQTIRAATMLTVLLSTFAHGLSARPCIELYARAIARSNGTHQSHDER